MISKERFTELWRSIIEKATVTDPDSPNYGRLVSVVNAENPDSIKDTCSPTLKAYLLAVADQTPIPELYERFEPFRHHTKSLEEHGAFCIDSFTSIKY